VSRARGLPQGSFEKGGEENDAPCGMPSDDGTTERFFDCVPKKTIKYSWLSAAPKHRKRESIA
jgi:hypothetical protein